ncbi:MAG: hypothetical protein APF76_14160 [Desulfitibacter sp. BRH_c19]|nr:MAG: hypothetical protein APF76_14160 [Desulfitibacter sp. BRH_c19]
MPRGDGTGPMGMGPMTGRGAGNCASTTNSVFANYAGARSRQGICGGRGFRRIRYLKGIQGGEGGYTTPISNEQVYDEKVALKNQEELLKKQLKQVKARLENFEEK